jgi:hypothetical protein
MWQQRSHKFCGRAKNRILSTNWPARASTPTRSCCEPLLVSHDCGQCSCGYRLPYGMHWPVLLRGCRTRHSPAIRLNLCRLTLRPPKGCRGFAHLEFRRDRSKMNSKRYSGEANEEFATVTIVLPWPVRSDLEAATGHCLIWVTNFPRISCGLLARPLLCRRTQYRGPPGLTAPEH